MKTGKLIGKCVILAALGITLMVLGCLEIVDSFWSGMGGALIAVSAVRLVQSLRYQRNEEYREKVDTELGDERNQFIRNKAWAWAGYLFVLIAAVSCIVLKVMGQELLSVVAGGAVCLMIVLYWVSFLILRKKY